MANNLAQPTQPSNVFDEILRKGIAEGIIPERTSKARDWYRQQARRIANVSDSQLMKSDPTRFRQALVPGRMYMFYYDPKGKVKLPYYDTFPLIFPLDVKSDRFLGLNIHYLPPVLRVKLMDALYLYINNNRFDETTKLQISYKILSQFSATRYYKPCIKMYLKEHVRSRFVAVGANEWSIACFLPTERFTKTPATKVWNDSQALLAKS